MLKVFKVLDFLTSEFNLFQCSGPADLTPLNENLVLFLVNW